MLRHLVSGQVRCSLAKSSLFFTCRACRNGVLRGLLPNKWVSISRRRIVEVLSSNSWSCFILKDVMKGLRLSASNLLRFSLYWNKWLVLLQWIIWNYVSPLLRERSNRWRPLRKKWKEPDLMLLRLPEKPNATEFFSQNWQNDNQLGSSKRKVKR